MNILLWIGAIIFGTILILYGSEWLENSSSKISEYYGVPPIVRGSIITAFGSSFPELSSVVIATVVHGEFKLGISIIIGSAIFNIVFIPAIAGLKANGLDLGGKKVRNEITIYVFVILSVTLFFVLSFITYVDDPSITNYDTEVPLNPYFAVSLLVIYVIYVVYQWRIAHGFKQQKESKVSSIKKPWTFLIVGLLVIGIGVELLVRSVIELGDIFDTPSLLWGLVIVASASSLPDALVSIKQADGEEHATSFANVAGSNTFDLLVVLSIGVIVAGGTVVQLGVIVPLMIVLLVFSVIMLYFIRNDGYLAKAESYVLVIMYLLFCIWILMEAIEVVDYI